MHKVVHLSSAHPRFDTRIFWKQCCSLSQEGYQVSLLVADGKGDELSHGVSILDVGAAKGRFDRILSAPKKLFKIALRLDANIYHLHDPELLPIGLKLKRMGKKVVFDAHEDFPKQLLSKPYLNNLMRKLLSFSAMVYESYACRKIDGVVAATPFIRDKFCKSGIFCIDVNNFPLLNELCITPNDWTKKKSQVCYVGGLGAVRGIKEIVQAMEHCSEGIKLAIGGKFTERQFESIVKAERGWSSVIDEGWLDRDGVRSLLNDSIAGLVTLHPIINYLDALPVKMFEYMACGLPVIASDFPLWKDIVESNRCGVCVNPLEPLEIAKAISTMKENYLEAEEMGLRGRKAVFEKYNWDIEKEKLYKFYLQILK